MSFLTVLREKDQEIEDLKEAKDKLLDKLLRSTEENSELELEIETLKEASRSMVLIKNTEIKRLRCLVDKKGQNIEDLSQDLSRNIESLKEANKLIREKEAKIESLKDKSEDLRNELKRENELLDDMLRNIESFIEANKEIEEKNESLKAEIKSLRGELEEKSYLMKGLQDGIDHRDTVYFAKVKEELDKSDKENKELVSLRTEIAEKDDKIARQHFLLKSLKEQQKQENLLNVKALTVLGYEKDQEIEGLKDLHQNQIAGLRKNKEYWYQDSKEKDQEIKSLKEANYVNYYLKSKQENEYLKEQLEDLKESLCWANSWTTRKR